MGWDKELIIIPCSGREELVCILLSAGANPNTRTGPPQKTPLQLAAAGGHVVVMEMSSPADWAAPPPPQMSSYPADPEGMQAGLQ